VERDGLGRERRLRLFARLHALHSTARIAPAAKASVRLTVRRTSNRKNKETDRPRVTVFTT
jgi:hypothetical protein